MARALSETDLRDPHPKRNAHGKRLSPATEVDEGEEQDSIRNLLSSSGLGESKPCGVEDGLAVGGGIFGGGGGGCGRGSNGGDGHGHGHGHGRGGGGAFESNQGHESTDLYYQKMIEANPGNALLLGNYAKFLKEVNVKTNFLFGSPEMLGNLKKFYNFNSFIFGLDIIMT